MSVINRMLNDLERRGAPGARRQRGADGPARAESPRGALRRLRRLGPPMLLVALLLVAAALWREQWPRVLALVESTRKPPVAAGTATDDNASGEAPLPDVRLFRFERDGATTRLIVAFDRPLGEAPGYGRSGDQIGLQLPARWGRDEVPAPPGDQSVYRSAVVEERGEEGTRIGMRVDPEARFDLAIDRDRLILTGRASADERDDSGDGGATETVNSGNAGTTTQSDTTKVAEQPEQTDDATGDTDARATDGQNVTDPDGDPGRTGGSGGTRTVAAAGNDESRAAEARTNAANGTVRKSEPDIAPQERARRLEGKAREALDDGDVTAARTRLAKALAFDADRHSARDLLVGLALRSGDAATARNLLAEGVARAPQRGAYAKPFARLLVDAGDLERALRVLRRAAPTADRDAGYHGLTAAVAQRLKRHELAASEYTRALEIDSSRGVWWMGLGISLRATDHPDEALAAFREARASDDLTERLDRWVQQRIDALSRIGE